MKIVVPTEGKKGLNDRVADHFGRSSTYTFLDEKGGIVSIADNTSEHMGGSGLPPEMMKARGADVLLCRELGPKALNLCRRLGIEVYVCRAETVGEIFEMWENRKAKKAGDKDICKKHKMSD